MVRFTDKRWFLVAMIPWLASACTTGVLRNEPPGQVGQMRLEIGPMTLNPSPGHHHGAGHGPHQGSMLESFELLEVAEPGWITSFHPAMEDATGAPAPTELLHHVVIGEFGKRASHCLEVPLLPGASAILATGAEATPVDIPAGYGIPLDAGSRLAVWGMFHNPLHQAYAGVRFAGRIGYVPRASGVALKSLTPLWLDVIPRCPKHGYTVPAGGRHVQRRVFEFSAPGRLVYGAGHLHDHGVLLRVYRQGDGVELVRFVPRLDANGRLLGIAPVAPRDPPAVQPGVPYVLEAVYDNTTGHDLWSMGIAVLLLAGE